MNKTKIYIISMLAAAMSLNIGCTSTMKSAMNDARSMINLPRGDKDTDALYSKVSDKDRQQVNDLNRELAVIKKTAIISKLVEDRDDLQQERSELHRKRTDLLTRETEYRVRLAKLEAIDRNKLGVRIDNIEAITDTHVDAVEVQTKRLKIDGKVSILDVEIEQLTKQINNLKQELTNMSDNTVTLSSKETNSNNNGY